MHPLRGFIGSNLFSENVAFSSEYEVNSGVFQTSVLLFWLLMWWQEASLLHKSAEGRSGLGSEEPWALFITVAYAHNRP